MKVLAIDAGTTGVTCLVLDGDEVIGRAYAEIEQHYPQPGWVEHDPQEILDQVVAVGRQACRDAAVRPSSLAAIGITNQRETTVVWDDAGPIHPAIVWQDRRTDAACKALAPHRNLVRQKTGLELDAYFCATKIAWILDNVPDARERAVAGELRFGTIDTWLAWCLTGRHVTDPTNASRTMLWDIHTSQWDPALLELFDVPSQVLPDVVPSSHVIGACPDFDGAPLAALVGDQQAALFGQGATEAGQAKATYGTGCFLLQHTGNQAVASQHGLLTTRAASLDETPQYALEGSVFVGGAAIQWLRDGLQIIDAAPEINDLAAPSSEGVVVVPAFTGLGAPYWDGQARGAVLGIHRGTTKAHIARATLEAIAMQCDDVLRAMVQDSGVALPELRVDGGASQSERLMQLQADISRVPVLRAACVETTALGAGRLAALAVGGGACNPKTGQGWVPSLKSEKAQALRSRWDAAVQATRSFQPES